MNRWRHFCAVRCFDMFNWLMCSFGMVPKESQIYCLRWVRFMRVGSGGFRVGGDYRMQTVRPLSYSTAIHSLALKKILSRKSIFLFIVTCEGEGHNRLFCISLGTPSLIVFF